MGKGSARHAASRNDAHEDGDIVTAATSASVRANDTNGNKNGDDCPTPPRGDEYHHGHCHGLLPPSHHREQADDARDDDTNHDEDAAKASGDTSDMTHDGDGGGGVEEGEVEEEDVDGPPCTLPMEYWMRSEVRNNCRRVGSCSCSLICRNGVFVSVQAFIVCLRPVYYSLATRRVACCSLCCLSLTPRGTLLSSLYFTSIRTVSLCFLPR
mmetsp:Transcript_16412/g.40143  ORF Transcript_16412/g.40143 Transcript_16412/m.40143 type:complete len:211 (-) Transcript_16412:715-1347(-)